MSQSARIGDAIIDLYAAVEKGRTALLEMTVEMYGAKKGSKAPVWFKELTAAIETLAEESICPDHFDSLEEALHSRD